MREGLIMLTNICNFISIIAAGSQGANSVDPIYDFIDTVGPYAISIVLVLGLFYGVIMGVKFAKTEKAEERAVLQKALINGVIGFLTVLVLIIVLYAIREPLVDWMNS